LRVVPNLDTTYKRGGRVAGAALCGFYLGETAFQREKTEKFTDLKGQGMPCKREKNGISFKALSGGTF
jgi:hypothetical protein